MLVTLNDILPQFRKKDAAVGAFNLALLTDCKPAIEAAEERGMPIILQISPLVAQFVDYESWGTLAAGMAEKAKVPVCIHLDHANKVEDIQKAIDAGFSSVMFDGSQLPIDENIRLTKEVVRRAKEKGVSVEAEIGSVAYQGLDTHKSQLTDPLEARRFVEESGCDCVAVAVGTLHRMESQEAKLQFDLLKEIEAQVDIPLVIHGSTGLKDEELIRLRKTSVCKVNIGTALRLAYNKSLRQELAKHPEDYIYLELLKAPMEEMKRVIKHKMELLGC